MRVAPRGLRIGHQVSLLHGNHVVVVRHHQGTWPSSRRRRALDEYGSPALFPGQSSVMTKVSLPKWPSARSTSTQAPVARMACVFQWCPPSLDGLVRCFQGAGRDRVRVALSFVSRGGSKKSCFSRGVPARRSAAKDKSHTRVAPRKRARHRPHAHASFVALAHMEVPPQRP